MMAVMKTPASAVSATIVLITCSVMAMFLNSEQVATMKKSNEPTVIGIKNIEPRTDTPKKEEIKVEKTKNPIDEPNANKWFWTAQDNPTVEEESTSSAKTFVPVLPKIPTNLNDISQLAQSIPTMQDVAEGQFQIPDNNFSIAQTGLKILVLVFVMLEILLLKDKVQGLEEKASRESLIERQMFELEKEKLNVQKHRITYELEKTQEKIDKFSADTRKLENQLSDLNSPSGVSAPGTSGDSRDSGD